MIAMLSLSLVFLVMSVPAAARSDATAQSRNVGAAAELVANLIGAGVAVALAIDGAGAWSLVAQYLATYAMRAIVLNISGFRNAAL